MATALGLRVGEAVLGGVVLGLGLFVGIETALLEVAPSNAAIGPRLFPFLVASGLVIVGLLVLRQALFGHVAHERGFELDWGAVAWVGGGLLVQLWLVERLGWVLATALLFLAGTLAFRDRRILLNLVIGLALAALTFWVFNDGLGLSLPVGTVFEDLLAGDEPAE
ncbi:MAG: tripartite tricarboxylate transporter TctB family protein [Geminicoccaceae bacterium]